MEIQKETKPKLSKPQISTEYIKHRILPKVLMAVTHVVIILLLTVLNIQLEPEKRPGPAFWVFFSMIVVSTVVLYSLAGLSDPGYVN
jgi:hypothetical protein